MKCKNDRLCKTFFFLGEIYFMRPEALLAPQIVNEEGPFIFLF